MLIAVRFHRSYLCYGSWVVGAAVSERHSFAGLAAAGLALTPPALGEAWARGWVTPLQHLTADEPRLQLGGVNAALQRAAAVAGQQAGLAYSSEVPLLMYRRDVLGALGAQPPETWSELVQLAQRLNGTDLPCTQGGADSSAGANTSEACPSPPRQAAGFCIALPDGCSSDGVLLAAIWASMAAMQGPRHGLFFEPHTMRLRLGGAALQAALHTYG